MLKLIASITLAAEAAACVAPAPEESLVAQLETIGYVNYEITGDTAPHAMGISHIVELTNANTAGGHVQNVVGQDAPGVGLVVAIDAPRMKFYPAGYLVGFVVAAP